MFEDFPEIEKYKIKDNRSKIVCEENGAEITFHNPKGKIVEKIKIDGGIITDKTVKKCDYLVSCLDIKMAIFVELKGNKVMVAIEQLSATLDNTAIKTAIEGYTKNAYAVVARGALVPKVNTGIQHKQESFRKWKNCILKVVTSPANRDLITGKAL
jgi:hypothetical protein